MLKKKRIHILLIIYLVLIIWTLLFKLNIDALLRIAEKQATPFWERATLSLIPFQKFIIDMQNGDKIELWAFVLNYFLLIPLGILLPFYMSKRKSVVGILVFCVSMEVVQLLTCMGGFETTDILINGLGGITGIWMYHRITPGIQDKTINRICLLMIILFGPVAVYALVRTALAFPHYIALWRK